MAIVEEVILKLGSCEGPNITATGSRTYRETYIVRTDVPINDGFLVITKALEVTAGRGTLPVRGTTFTSDPGAICTEYSPKQNRDVDRVWEVVVTYDSERDASDVQPGEPPWSKPPRWSWSSVTVETAPFEDLEGDPFMTSAYDRFDPPPTIPIEHSVLIVEKDQLAFDFLAAQQLANLVNEETFAGLPPRSMKLAFPTATVEQADGQSYWKVTYSFEIANIDPGPPLKVVDPWIPFLVPNIGPHYLTLPHPMPAGGKRKLAADDDNVTHSGMVMLKQDGTKAATPAELYQRQFVIYRELDYNTVIPQVL